MRLIERMEADRREVGVRGVGTRMGAYKHSGAGRHAEGSARKDFLGWAIQPLRGVQSFDPGLTECSGM